MGSKQTLQTGSKLSQKAKMSDLTDFKVAITNVFKGLKKKMMIKEVKESMIIPHQIENINKNGRDYAE